MCRVRNVALLGTITSSGTLSGRAPKMRIEYHDLSEKDFERLVVAICAEILGSGVVPFCTGPDGSRDARFEGTAADLPNAAAPHKGKFVAQSKHSESPVAKFSDSDFSGTAKSSVLSKECPGVKKLVKSKELDIYLLFANRKMSGVAEGPIIDRIKKDTGVKVVEIFGIERIDLLLRKHPNILKTFGMTPLHLPILVTCDALAEVILAISNNSDTFEKAFVPEELERISFKEKNEANGLSDELAKYIRRTFMPQFADVKKFLAKPESDAVLERYLAAAQQFEEQIVIHRSQYANFDQVLTRIAELLFARDGDLAKKRALTKLIIYYMYWNCDIGSKVESDAAAE